MWVLIWDWVQFLEEGLRLRLVIVVEHEVIKLRDGG